LKNYRPLLIQDLNLQMPGIQIQRLRLNRHLPEARWTEHSHPHDQVLIYLMGRGQQRVDGVLYPARPGTVIHVPPGQSHAFEQQAGRQPLCLVVDVEMQGGRGVAHTCDHLTAEQLTETKARLSTLFRVQHIERKEMSFRVAAVVLDILDMALKAVGWLTPVNRFSTARHFSNAKRVERLLETKDGADVSLEDIAKLTGYQHDHLNRLLRAECGLTLGQLRSRIRLKRAVALLADQVPVQEVGEKVGILDPNYFARWFRQQTGVSPSSWKRRPSELRF
jgi:AraC-like DNA-binding protein/mannose-6-phosphate isomerase-like protein (cupin superfamily)